MSTNRQRAADKLAALQSRLKGKPTRRRPSRGRFEGVGNCWPVHLLGEDLPADDMPPWLFQVNER